jgi:hypothetical protein
MSIIQEEANKEKSTAIANLASVVMVVVFCPERLSRTVRDLIDDCYLIISV